MTEAGNDWKYGRHYYRFRAGVARYIKRVLARARRHEATNLVRTDLRDHAIDQELEDARYEDEWGDA